MQVVPGTHLHLAILAILSGIVLIWFWPGGGIGVKTASCPQAREGSCSQGTPGRSQLPRLVACIEDKDGQGSIVRIAVQELFDLFDGDEIHVVIGLEPTDLAWSCPAIIGKADLSDPMLGPARHNRLSS